MAAAAGCAAAHRQPLAGRLLPPHQMRYSTWMPSSWKQARMVSAVASHSSRRESSSGLPTT